MKYIAISDQVQDALGLSDTAKPRLLRQINLLRQDISAVTDWDFLRRRQKDVAYVAGSPIPLPDGVLGVRLVRSTAGTIYYHANEGLIPDGIGLRFWSRGWADQGEQHVDEIQLWSDTGAEVDLDTVGLWYWIKPADLDVETVVSTEIEFPGTDALISGLTGRWHRYEERDPEKAAVIEPEYAQEHFDIVLL